MIDKLKSSEVFITLKGKPSSNDMPTPKWFDKINELVDAVNNEIKIREYNISSLNRFTDKTNKRLDKLEKLASSAKWYISENDAPKMVMFDCNRVEQIEQRLDKLESHKHNQNDDDPFRPRNSTQTSEPICNSQNAKRDIKDLKQVIQEVYELASCHSCNLECETYDDVRQIASKLKPYIEEK